MKDTATELVDLVLTQAIERYLQMEPLEAEKTITKEWPDQIGILLKCFLYHKLCEKCQKPVMFASLIKRDGSSAYVAPICSCKSRIPFRFGN